MIQKDDSLSAKITGYDLTLAKEVGDTLYKHYPNWMWCVEILDHCVKITLAEQLQNGWCYFINRKDIPVGSPEKLRKLVITKGGEYLERLGQARKGKEEHQTVEQLIEGTEKSAMMNSSGISKFRKNDIILPGNYLDGK